MNKKYLQYIEFIESRGIMPSKPPGLEVMKRGLKEIGFYHWDWFKKNEDDPSKITIVAGTNGKGSVCAMLDALLGTAGERVGLYTSPHLIETTERIRIAGDDVSTDLFCDAFEAIQSKCNISDLSHFEILTLMAIWCFCSGEKVTPVDRVILEVGLGGTWDATNAVPHGLCIITTLGMDHQDMLGSTLLEIASNKFGVVAPNSTVVYSPFPNTEVAGLAQQVSQVTASQWVPAESFELQSERGPIEPIFWIDTKWGRVRLPLPGKRAGINAATALTAFEQCGYDPTRFLHALERVRWRGRMEKLFYPEASCPVYISGDHNVQGIESLIELLEMYRREKTYFVFGVSIDKQAELMLERLVQVPNSQLVFTVSPFKGKPWSEYAPLIEKWNALGDRDPIQALRLAAHRATANDCIVITGSLYLVGAFLKDEKRRRLTTEHKLD